MGGILCITHTATQIIVRIYAYESMHLDEFMYVRTSVCYVGASLFADASLQRSVSETRRHSTHIHLCMCVSVYVFECALVSVHVLFLLPLGA